jgi:hypothetical protein
LKFSRATMTGQALFVFAEQFLGFSEIILGLCKLGADCQRFAVLLNGLL